jgi:hypothetical protein
MLIASAHWAAASGRLSGVIASTGRGGAQLRAACSRVQPRSTSQQQNRSIVGSLAQAWRTLSPTAKNAWGFSAAANVSANQRGALFSRAGFAHFVSCNRNLVTIGSTQILTTPQPPPSLPGLAPFVATPQLDDTTTPPTLTGWLLTFNPAPAPLGVLVLRASRALSPGRRNIRPSELRIVATNAAWAPAGFTILAEWLAVYGTLPASGAITFAAHLVDPISGVASPELRACSIHNGVLPPPPAPGLINVEVNTAPLGTVPLQVIEVGGVIVAEP